MANAQESVGHEMTNQVCDHSALRSRVKTDQNVSAKNGVERTFDEIGVLVQIQPSEVDHLLDFAFHFHLAVSVRYSA
jgi:hypothetical protein